MTGVGYANTLWGIQGFVCGCKRIDNRFWVFFQGAWLLNSNSIWSNFILSDFQLQWFVWQNKIINHRCGHYYSISPSIHSAGSLLNINVYAQMFWGSGRSCQKTSIWSEYDRNAWPFSAIPISRDLPADNRLTLKRAPAPQNLERSRRKCGTNLFSHLSSLSFVLMNSPKLKRSSRSNYK